MLNSASKMGADINVRLSIKQQEVSLRDFPPRTAVIDISASTIGADMLNSDSKMTAGKDISASKINADMLKSDSNMRKWDNRNDIHMNNKRRIFLKTRIATRLS